MWNKKGAKITNTILYNKNKEKSTTIQDFKLCYQATVSDEK